MPQLAVYWWIKRMNKEAQRNFAIFGMKCINKKKQWVLLTVYYAPSTKCQFFLWLDGPFYDYRLRSSFISATFKKIIPRSGFFLLLYYFDFLLQKKKTCVSCMYHFSIILLSLKSLFLFNSPGFFDLVFYSSFCSFFLINVFFCLAISRLVPSLSWCFFH